MNRRDFLLSTTGLTLAPATVLGQEKTTPAANGDIVFADFERGTFDGWTLTGDCWDKQPATSKTFVDRQGNPLVSGIVGTGYLTTLHPKLGSSATGKAVSKDFTIDKPFLTFRIGGGYYPKAACLNLVVDGKIVRTETGNDSAELTPAYWDLYALMGKTAHLEVVDATANPKRGYVMADDLRLSEHANTYLQSQVGKLVVQYRTKYDYPAIWVAVSIHGQIVAVIADGVRRKDRPEVVSIHDKLMIGSVSKPVVGTLFGILIDKGLFRWDTTFKQIFPELAKEFDRPWLDATVLQFSTHLSGCPANPQGGFHSTNLSKTNLRLQFVRGLLATPEIGLPGKKYQYSSGHTVIAAMAERITKKPLEQLFAEYLYTPLGIRNGGIGTPVKDDQDYSQPWGHIRWTDTGQTIIRRLTDNNPTLEFQPSGGINMSILDLITFGSWHATRGRTQPNLSSSSGIEKMDYRPFNECFACGFWGDPKSAYGHNGLTGSHWTNLQIYPDEVAIAVFTNMAEGPVTNDYITAWPDLIVGPMINDIRKLIHN